MKTMLILCAGLLPHFLQAQPIKTGQDVPSPSEIAERYCVDLDKANQQIMQLNELSLENGKKIKVGTRATYEIKNEKRAFNGTILQEESYEESWTVVGIKDNVASIAVQTDRPSQGEETFSIAKPIFNRVLSKKDPLGCLFWSSFAAKIANGTLTVQGQEIKTIYRVQSQLGNALPETTYGFAVPFNLVRYVETSNFEDYQLIKNKQLTSFQF